MPSGRTHDAITFVLVPAAFAIAYAAIGTFSSAIIVGAAFLFGGLMFGPDLDTNSKQYGRWSVFRWLWFPYRSFFQHRSRFSHGLIFGALIRVVYLLGALTLGAFVLLYAYAWYRSGKLPDLVGLASAWRPIGDAIRLTFGDNTLMLTFIGMWLGAASHTLTDIAGSFIKTGRVAKFF